jgi:hypothetical protein
MSWISAHFENSSQILTLTYTSENGAFSEETRQWMLANGNPAPPVNVSLTIATTRTYSVAFQDCSVTLTQKAVNDATAKAVSGEVFLATNRDAVKQEKHAERDSTVVGPFDLGNLLPNKIVVELPNALYPSMIKNWAPAKNHGHRRDPKRSDH